ncbi:MAG TPA: hypothetical protein VF529_05830 [Solirubrobacteraceae bacterium]|jgi:hypothetical protein
MKSIKSRTAVTTAAIALLATPAFAQDAPKEPRGKGQSTSPAKICKDQSRKKTNHGKGKSPFAACVVGVKRQTTEAQQTPNPSEQRAPGQICAGQSRKKDKNDSKSPFAACVVGVTRERKEQREQEQQS